MYPCFASPKTPSSPLIIVNKKTLPDWLKNQPAAVKNRVKSLLFEGRSNTCCTFLDDNGTLKFTLVGTPEKLDIWSIAHLPAQLPAGTYRLEGKFSKELATSLSLGWALATYRFTRYKKIDQRAVQLILPKNCDTARLNALIEAIYLTRDLINTPANDMGPTQLAAAARDLAKKHKARTSEIIGDDLLAKNYPAIHTVGRASADAPRLVDITWGDPKHPKVTLVGKGVCFDSGGLDIKSAAAMRLMKKDMGGAATLLALAGLIMTRKLPIRLRLLLPIVENSISANAFRPGDIIATRKGISVEIGNTDAEGRLILCDALAEADREKPDLLIDCATLTGAARVALGTDMPAFFTSDDALADALREHSASCSDPLWRLPLWAPYRESMNSPVADINSAPDSAYAGAITAALYLKEFVPGSPRWLHIDMMSWNIGNRPGRPEGGEAMALRALFSLIEERYN